MGDAKRGSLLIQVLVLAMLIAFLGAAGFYYFEHQVLRPNPLYVSSQLADRRYSQKFNAITPLDSLWWALVTMTTIGYGDVYPMTWEGRVIALVLMFVGIGTLGVSTAAIAAYFIKSDQLEMFRLRHLRDHVVICGLGAKGLLLARSFRARGDSVVVIEQEETNESISSCRELGALVLTGDATEPNVLALARVGQAKNLVAVCGNDGTNAEIAAHARDLGNKRTGTPLTCSIHIVEPELWFLLRKWELSVSGSFRLQFFNVYDIGARALLESFPPFTEAEVVSAVMTARSPHLLVIGTNKLGQSLIAHAARGWRDRSLSEVHTLEGDAAEGDAPTPTKPRLRITMIDANTERTREFLHLRHPELERICDITALPIDVNSPEFHRARFLFNEEGECDLSAVYVCLDEDVASLAAALSLHHRLARFGVPLVVHLTQRTGLVSLLRGVEESGQGFETLHAEAMLERACQPDLVLGGINEILARAIHDQYLLDQERQGKTLQTNPQMVKWDELPDEIKESNRNQAALLGTKLSVIGCDLAPLTSWDARFFTFATEEVELLARMEHERWMSERLAQGWTYGTRDVALKKNENLLPWHQLSQPAREMNENAVREVPAFLAQAGFQIYRMHSTRKPPAEAT